MLIAAIAALSLLISGAVYVCWGVLWAVPAAFAASFLVLALLAFLFLWYMCERVDLSVPQEEDDPFYRKMVELYITSVLPVIRIHVVSRGMEQVPQSGRFMLVCNHTNDSDPVLLLNCFKGKQLAFISKQENQDMFLVGKVMHKLQCQLINRENDREALKTILKCIQILKEDKASIAVFPEGGIDDDGLLHHFRPGVFKIAQKAKVPVVVCTLKNTKNVIRNILRFKRSDVELHVLEVIRPEEFAGITTVELAQRCHDLMAADLGSELVGD